MVHSVVGCGFSTGDLVDSLASCGVGHCGCVTGGSLFINCRGRAGFIVLLAGT